MIQEKDVDKAITIIGGGRIVRQRGEVIVQGEKELNDEIEQAKEEIRTNPRPRKVL
jgi:hypothetical protein